MVKLSEVAQKERSSDTTARAYYQITEGEADVESDSLDMFLQAVVEGRGGECDYCDASRDDQLLRIEGEAESTDRMSHPDAVVFYLDAVSLTCSRCPSIEPGVQAPHGGTPSESVRRRGNSLAPDWGQSPDDGAGIDSQGADTGTGSQSARRQSDTHTGGKQSSSEKGWSVDEQTEFSEETDRTVVARDDGTPVYPDEDRIASERMGPDQLGGPENGAAPGGRSSVIDNSGSPGFQHPVFTPIRNSLSGIRVLLVGVLTRLLVPGQIAAAMISRFYQSQKNALVGLAVVIGFGIGGAVFVVPDWPLSGIGGWEMVPRRPSDLGAYGLASVIGGTYIAFLWGAWTFQSGRAVPPGTPSTVPSYRHRLSRRLIGLGVVAVGLIILAVGSHFSPTSVVESEFAIATVTFATGCYIATGLTAHRALVAIGSAVPTICGVNIAVVRALGHVLVMVCPWLWVSSTTLTGRVLTILLPVVYCAGVYGLSTHWRPVSKSH